ncbi:sigma factor [Virgibacillus ainsalahensis]
MMTKEKMTFEEIYKQNERRIYYQIHKLNISDPQQVFYAHGLVAMWNAYEKYESDKGPLATYFNYTIRNRMIDEIRKQTREKEKETLYLQEQEIHWSDGNYRQNENATYPVIKPQATRVYDEAF